METCTKHKQKMVATETSIKKQPFETQFLTAAYMLVIGNNFLCLPFPHKLQCCATIQCCVHQITSIFYQLSLVFTSDTSASISTSIGHQCLLTSNASTNTRKRNQTHFHGEIRAVVLALILASLVKTQVFAGHFHFKGT